MRERVIERYLKNEVRKAGGATKKMRNINDPDQLVIWPGAWISVKHISRLPAEVDFVECKAPGKKARPAQAREHVRLHKLGCRVLVLDTKEKINNYIRSRTDGL